MNSTDGEAVRLVEVRHRPVVLHLSVLHDHVRFGPVAIDGQFRLSAGRSGIPAQPLEPVLALTDFTKRQDSQS